MALKATLAAWELSRLFPLLTDEGIDHPSLFEELADDV